jgi:putative GTP pyrophosphokinase
MYRQVLPLASRRSLQQQYEQHAAGLEKALHELQRRIGHAVRNIDVRPTLKHRVKSFDSYYEKLLRRSREKHDGEEVEITDLLGIRVVCPFMEEIQTIESALHAAFSVREVERKGSQLGFQEFGYSSVHLLVDLPDDIRDSFHLGSTWICEVQLRTILQDAWAEVEHELVYKADLTPLDQRLRRKLAALNANLTLSDIIFQEIRDYQRSLHRKLMRRRETFWSELGEIDEIEIENGNAVDGDSEIIETGSDTIDVMLIQALQAHNEKDYESAARIYSDILAYQPSEHIAAIIHTHRGMARFALGDVDGAIEDFSTTIRMSPHTTKAYYYRGVVERAKGRTDQALNDFSRCLEYDPYHIESRVARARLYRTLGNLDAANADFRMACDLDPDHPAVDQLAAEFEDRPRSNA